MDSQVHEKIRAEFMNFHLRFLGHRGKKKQKVKRKSQIPVGKLVRQFCILNHIALQNLVQQAASGPNQKIRYQPKNQTMFHSFIPILIFYFVVLFSHATQMRPRKWKRWMLLNKFSNKPTFSILLISIHLEHQYYKHPIFSYSYIFTLPNGPKKR